MTFNISEPGKFEFSKPSYIVREGSGKAQIYVNRINGADGTVSVRWQTKDMSAKSHKDYVGADGILAFSHGETQKTVDILIIDTDVSFSFYFVDLILYFPSTLFQLNRDGSSWVEPVQS